MNKTAISWTDFSLNPIRFRNTETGKVGWYCQKVSAGCAHCLHPDTLILYADMTWKPLRDVHVGDEIAGFDETPLIRNPSGKGARRLRKATVEAVWKTRKRAIKITTPQTEIIASDDHPFLTHHVSRWIKPKDFTLSTSLRFVGEAREFEESESYMRGYLMGMTDGDGTMRFEPGQRSDKLGFPQCYWRVALADSEPIERLQRYLSHFGIAVNIRPFKQNQGHGISKPMTKVETRSIAMLEILHKLLEYDDECLDYGRGYLAGVFDAEGSFSRANLRIANKNLDYLNKVVAYGTQLGLDFRIEPANLKGVYNARLYGERRNIVRFFSRTNPAIIRKRAHMWDRQMDAEQACVTSLEDMGDMELIDIQTSTRTFIANGLMTHNCYAETLNNRFGAMVRYDVPSAAKGSFFLDMKMLGKLYKEKKPSRCFIFDMTDVFLELIPDWMVAVCFYAFLDNPHHTIQLLTKRPERAVDWHERFIAAQQTDEFKALAHEHQATWGSKTFTNPWGANIWMGTSVESGATTHRIETLRRVPAQTRYISAEPLLGDWGAVDLSGIHQVIIGGESGQHMMITDANGKRVRNEARWMKMEWALSIKNQCVDQGVAAFFKQQSGIRTEMDTFMIEPDGGRWSWQQYPRDLRPPVNLAAPALPTEPHPGDDLEALRAGSDERIANTLAELVPDPDPISPAPVTKTEPDYADPFDLPLNAKVITLQQPYASAVMAGVKQIETRSWKTPYRGALVIHAGKAWNDDLKEKANSELIASALRSKGLDPNALPLGMALGVVILDAVTPIENILSTLSDTEKAFGHYTDGNFAWCVSRPRPFREPLPGEGGLGLRDWSSYLAKIGKPVTLESITTPVEADAAPVTTVANFHHVYQHWNKATRTWDDPKYVYIGRYMPSFNLPSSMFANPFRIAKDTPENRAAAIEQYRTWITSKLADPVEGEAYRRELEALRGKHLVCWCSPQPCHGDVLKQLLGETVEHVEPPKPEAPSVQMSLFGEDEVPAKKKMVYA